LSIGQPGREDLLRWRGASPSNYYDASPNLARVFALRAGPALLAATGPNLGHFGQVVAEEVEPAVAMVERHREFPAHVKYDALGQHRESIEFHPAHLDAGRAIWASGMLALPNDRAGDFEMAGLFYLLSHVGEGGHACPVVCTAGLARALGRRGPDALAERHLDALRGRDYPRSARGSQFLTEIQGGSDVGANVTRAVPDVTVDGAWRITGEKWFCSVADAQLFAVMARPEGGVAGTRGLGLFLVPRSLDGSAPNGFAIRRLKDKLGTRAMASAEIDFDAALGWPIGTVEEGFHIAVQDLLNTSRWLNALGSTGIMRRAFLEASSFARHRLAFGRPIDSFPLVREQLAVIKSEEYAALSSTMVLTALLGRLDESVADESEERFYRFLVNANKYLTSISATDVARRGIEVLGGNGTIEDFSPMPRLYRDAMVYESWEGTHNVLCAQVQRDCVRLGLLDDVLVWVRKELATAGAGADAGLVADALDRLEPRLQRSLRDAGSGAAHFRRQLDALVRAIQAASLLHEAAGEEPATGKAAAAALFVRRHLAPGYVPDDDPSWGDRIDAVVAGDAG